MLPPCVQMLRNFAETAVLFNRNCVAHSALLSGAPAASAYGGYGGYGGVGAGPCGFGGLGMLGESGKLDFGGGRRLTGSHKAAAAPGGGESVEMRGARLGSAAVGASAGGGSSKARIIREARAARQAGGQCSSLGSTAESTAEDEQAGVEAWPPDPSFKALRGEASTKEVFEGEEPHSATWLHFSAAWNALVITLRHGDFVSDAERDALVFHTLRGPEV